MRGRRQSVALRRTEVLPKAHQVLPRGRAQKKTGLGQGGPRRGRSHFRCPAGTDGASRFGVAFDRVSEPGRTRCLWGRFGPASNTHQTGLEAGLNLPLGQRPIRWARTVPIPPRRWLKAMGPSFLVVPRRGSWTVRHLCMMRPRTATFAQWVGRRSLLISRRWAGTPALLRSTGFTSADRVPAAGWRQIACVGTRNVGRSRMISMRRCGARWPPG